MKLFAALVVLLSVVCQQGISRRVFQTCKDIKDNTPSDLRDNLVSGYYFILLQSGIGIQVYCTNMESSVVDTPIEYINLPSGRSRNFGEFYKYVGSTTSCTLEEPPEEVFAEAGKTEFEKLKFDPKSRSIITNDFTYATNVGTGNSIKFGTAGDKHSYSSSCVPLGRFSIDLAGTPWIVNRDMTWNWIGSFANGDTSSGKAAIVTKTYLGCYIDQNPRDLPENIWHHPSMTGSVCSQHCAENGFEYAGTQYTDECYCGHTYGNFGKANETDCDMPCAADPNEMCGGVWRNSVYKTGESQTVEGSCGGYPGSCYPTLNYKDEEQIKLDIIENHPCLGSTSPCYNEGVCVATDNDQFLCLCHTGYTGTYCELLEEPQTYTSEASATHDDAHAYVSCPPGMIGIKCECEGRYCDGAAFVADECEVTNSNQGKSSKSVITCVQHDPNYQRMVNVDSTNFHNPRAQCPQHSILTGCASVDPWFQQVTYGRGVIDNSTTPSTCTQDYCQSTPNGCRVQARCLVAECECQNGGTCIHASGMCACPEGYYGTKCESFDYCAYYEDKNNAPPCLNGGSCVGVPSHVIATTGGTGNNNNCEFPFVYQSMSYSKCVDRNLVGPPFACSATLDGIDSYIDFGQWNPGPIYTMEVWARALEIQDGRRAIAGGFSDCRDWGIGLEGGKFKAFYDPPDSCTAAITYDQPVELNRWYYMTKISDGQTAMFYVDGNLVGSATVRYMTPGTSIGFYVGGEECCGNFFHGEVKSLRVWKRVLTETEIKDNYANEHKYHDSSREDALQNGLVGYWDFGETKHPVCVGVDHMGADWSVDNGEVLSGVHCNITRFIIPESHTVSVREWDGGEGSGKVEIYAKDIDIYGTLTANGKGYKGGSTPQSDSESGFQGESFSGNSDHTISANIGGGGGGGGELDGSGGHGKPGGGGGYGKTGGTCKLRPDKDVSHCGQGGGVYGDEKLSTLHLGSGGGSGGNDNKLTDNPKGGKGGNGGGAIRLDALRRIEIVGYVQADGNIGQGDVSTGCEVCPSACSDQVDCAGGSTTSCYDFSGAGGGGSGGSLYLRGQIVNVGLNHISANGGRGGHGAFAACGGDGGSGRIRIDYVELIGKYPNYAYLQQYDSTYTDKSYVGQQEIDLSNTNYGNEVYLGCHQDQDDRHMEFRVNLNDNEMAQMTPEYCIKRCRDEGYKYSGTQFSNECYCDNEIGKFPRLNEGACTMTCAGDNRQICGDSLRLTVYGPPPTHGAAVEKNGVIQSCKPWCKNGDSPGGFLWGECVNDGYVFEYEARCECEAGFSGKDCGQFCPTNTWGQGCLNTCDCVDGHTTQCDPISGACNCKSGYEGERCQFACQSGKWGNGCANMCTCINSDQPNVCEAVDGQCTCQDGYTGTKCDTTCPDGKWGSNCINSCSCANGYCSPGDGSCSCSPGFTGTKCEEECSANTWGSNCVNICGCNGHSCDSKTGACICPPTTTGDQCQNGCPPNKWGNNCANDCNCGEHAEGCEVSTGSCSCEAGYTGSTCEQECPVGKFGRNCAYSCLCDINNIERCHPETGQCECKSGYEGVQCHSPCPEGKYGVLCSMTCQCSGTAQCDPITGSCDSCPVGFIGENCQSSCPANFYGNQCREQCGCSSEGLDYCDGVTGFCYCKAGYYGTTCLYTCGLNHWGPDCAYTCSCLSQNTQKCDPTTGVCICNNGYQGETCSQCTTNQCVGTGCNCHNGGFCLTNGMCDCQPGYTGLSCDSECPEGKYGDNCAYTCDCQNGATCDKATGYCTCIPGFHGPRCEYICSDGYYGQNCAQICQCVYGRCNTATGACTCDAGFTGVSCSQSCPIGKYGPNCASTCACNLDHSSCNAATGECLCSAGYTGNTCTLTCPINYFGEDCQYSCPICGAYAEIGCDSVTGSCICKPGYKPPYCSDTCSEGYWGQNCVNTCSNQCRNGGSCDAMTGLCNCQAGYHSVDCSQTCDQGSYGPNCVASCQCVAGRSQSCDSVTGKCTCLPGYTGDICESSCPSGKYGTGCQLTCSCRLEYGSCDPVSGSCECNPGYQGSDCSQECTPGTWGKNCEETCLCSHFSSGCDSATGVCSCLSGYTGSLCEQECPEGFFGSNCQATCSCRNGGVCDHKDGYCECQPGYTGTNCESVCDFHKFGYNCALTCACDESISCDPASGICLCPSGWSGAECSIPCGSGYWGQGCGNQCPTGCPIAGQCDIVTGFCICPDGLGGKFCNQTCLAGKWGPDCIESCFSPCLDECDSQTGDCFCGKLGASCKNGGTCKKDKCHCIEGYGGSICTEPGQKTVKNGPSDAVIATAVIMSILVAIIIGLVIYLVYFKRSVNLSLSSLKSMDFSNIFKKQEDQKTLYTGDKVTIDNPNYNFDSTNA